MSQERTAAGHAGDEPPAKVRRARATTSGRRPEGADSGATARPDRPRRTRPAAAVEAAVSEAVSPSPAAPPIVRTIEVRQGSIGRAEAETVSVVQGAIGGVRGAQVSVELGAIGGAVAGEVRIDQGAAGTIIAREVVVEQSAVRTLIARDVVINRPSAAVVMIARRVSGDVRVLLDWRSALAFGAAFGLLAGLVRRRNRSD